MNKTGQCHNYLINLLRAKHIWLWKTEVVNEHVEYPSFLCSIYKT